MEIKRFAFGNKIITKSVVKEYPVLDSSKLNQFFDIQITQDNCILSLDLAKDTKIYGLGENVKGINRIRIPKRVANRSKFESIIKYNRNTQTTLFC